MLRIYNTLPFPTAYRDEDIKQISIEAEFRRITKVQIDVDRLRQAKDTAEMHSCFGYSQQLLAELTAVVAIEVEPKTKNGDKIIQQDMDSEEVVLLATQGELLTIPFLKDTRRLKTSRIEKVQQYCERIISYISRSERAMVALLDNPDAPKTEENEAERQTPGIAVALAQTATQDDTDVPVQVLNTKIDITIAKIVKLIDQDVVVAAEADSENGVKQFSEIETLAIEEEAAEYAQRLLAKVMGESNPEANQ